MKLDEIWAILPPLDELRPVLNLLAARSHPDPAHAWSGSGELESWGGRVLQGDELSGEAGELAAREQVHLARIFSGVGAALQALAAERREDAARAFLELAAAEEERTRPGRTVQWTRAALETLRPLRASRLSALAERRMARALGATGRLEEATTRYRASHDAALALEDLQGAAEAAIGAGNMLERQGRWADSRDWYERALELADRLEAQPVDGERDADSGEGTSSPPSVPAPERLHAVFNLHVVALGQGRLDESLGFLEEAGVLADRLDADGARPFLENSRGQLAMAARHFDEAEIHFRQALAAARDPRQRIIIGCNLAEACLARDRLLDAAGAAREAEREALTAGLIERMPEVCRILGRIAAARGSPDAFLLFERALQVISEAGLSGLEEARTLQAYAEAEALSGNGDTAHELRQRAQDRYAAAGIEHPRDRWVDVHAPIEGAPGTGGAP